MNIKFIKRLAFFICLAFLISLTPIQAVGQENRIIQTKQKNPAKLNKTILEGHDDLSDLKIGQPIPLYNWDGVKLNKDHSAYQCPVYKDEKIVAFYTIIDPINDGEAYQFGEGYAKELNEFLNGEEKNYCLIGCEGRVFALSEDKIKLLVDYGDMKIIPQELKAQINLMPPGNNKEEALKFYNLIKNNYLKSEIKSQRDKDVKEMALEIRKYYTEYRPLIQRNDDLRHTVSLQLMKRNGICDGSCMNRPYRYFGVDIYNQLPDQNICWAVASTRIGNYWKGQHRTPREAVQYIFGMNSHQGTIFDAQNVINNMYNLPSSYTYNGFSWSEVKDKIEGGYLMYGAFYNSQLTGGHAVCINGYYTDGSHDILIMESLGGCYDCIHPNSQGQYKMWRNGLGTLYWDASLVI